MLERLIGTIYFKTRFSNWCYVIITEKPCKQGNTFLLPAKGEGRDQTLPYAILLWVTKNIKRKYSSTAGMIFQYTRNVYNAKQRIDWLSGTAVYWLPAQHSRGDRMNVLSLYLFVLGDHSNVSRASGCCIHRRVGKPVPPVICYTLSISNNIITSKKQTEFKADPISE